MRSSTSILVAAILFLPAIAQACGACIEDKVAATYDHATVTSAAAKKQRVVFGEIDGPVDPRRVSEGILSMAAKIQGVQRGTVHASVAPPAFSFVLDPRVKTAAAATSELERRLAVPGLRLTVIRVQ